MSDKKYILGSATVKNPMKNEEVTATCILELQEDGTYSQLDDVAYNTAIQELVQAHLESKVEQTDYEPF